MCRISNDGGVYPRIYDDIEVDSQGKFMLQMIMHLLYFFNNNCVRVLQDLQIMSWAIEALLVV